MRCSRPLLSLVVIALALCGAGCGMGFSGGSIRFDDLKYPASMSGSLYGPNGEVTNTENGLKEIDGFYYSREYWSMFYSLVPLSGTNDIVEQMNMKIEKAGGDGMINVKVISDYSKLTSIWPLNLLPIWPGCSEVQVRGTIVKYVKK